MSLILGFNLTNEVVLVGDSMAVKGSIRQSGFPKLVRRSGAISGDCALGFTGDWDDIYAYLSLADRDAEADYTSTEWQIKHRRRCYDLLRPANWHEGDKCEPDLSILVAAPSGLYLVTNRGFVSQIPHYEVMGTGDEIIHYLYHTSPPPLGDPAGVIRWATDAITAVGQVLYTVGPPVLVEVVSKEGS